MHTSNRNTLSIPSATTLHVQCVARSAVRTIGVDLRVDVMTVLSVAGCRRAAVSGKSFVLW